jgi:hypothetical protein
LPAENGSFSRPIAASARTASRGLPPAASSTAYAFTVFELRLDAAGSGEAKTSLTAAVVVDDEAKTVALRDYATALPILALRTGASR